MGINPADAVKMFMQGAQKQNPNLDPAATAKNMLGDPNVQTPAQALEKLYQSGRIDQAAYEMFKGMV
jgi:hypothetical protein